MKRLEFTFDFEEVAVPAKLDWMIEGCNRLSSWKWDWWPSLKVDSRDEESLKRGKSDKCLLCGAPILIA